MFLSGNNNLVTGNRIQETPLGIWNYSGTGNTYPTTGAGKNNLFNVGQATSAGFALKVQVSTSTASRTPAPPRF